MKPILLWQRDQISKELLLLQGHISDPTCPCKTDGEKCVRKHLLTVEALAQETIPIEDSDARAEELGQLANEARELRAEEEKNLCGQAPKFKWPLDTWSRDWRKKFETLACELDGHKKPKVAMHQEVVVCQEHTAKAGQRMVCDCRPVTQKDEAEMGVCPACIAAMIQEPAPRVVTCPPLDKPKDGG